MSAAMITNNTNDPSLNEIGHYVVTSHPPGSVLSAVRCSFFGDGSVDVAIAKSNRLEIRQYRACPADDSSSDPSLPLLLTLPIHGRITSLLSIRFPSLPRDCLFFTTERGSTLSVTELDGSDVVGRQYPVKTHVTGSFANYAASIFSGGCQSECGPLVALDERKRCIALHMYDEWITILPIHIGYDGTMSKRSGPLGDAFHVRIEEKTVLSMAFLQTNKSSSGKGKLYIPQLTLLHQDVRGFQHVITHGVDLSKKSLVLHSAPDNASSSMEGKPSATTMPPPLERLKKTRIDGGSAAIVSVPASRTSSLGGVLILGQRQITYHHTGEGITRTLPVGGDLLLYSYCMVNETHGDETEDERQRQAAQLKYLLGDEMGRIHVLTLLRNVASDGKGDGCVTTLLLETLGTASSSSALVYLGHGCVFVGSQFGDSQLVKILDAPVPLSGSIDGGEEKNPLEETTYLRVLEEYTNLGPIVDFDLRPCGDGHVSGGGRKDDSRTTKRTTGNQHHQSVLVTCSGVGKDGSVRLVRNGVGMMEHAEVEMPGIKGMWSLRRKFSDEDDMFLVQSFVRETRILGVHSSGSGDEMDESEDGGAALAEVTIPGFDSSKSTLFAGNVMVGRFDLMLQVVQDGIRVVDSESLDLVSEWSPFSSDDDSDADEPLGLITVAAANESGQIVVALHGGILMYFLVEGLESSPMIRTVKRTTLDREISCIDLNPFEPIRGDNDMDLDGERIVRSSELVAVGLWDDFSVRLLSLCDNAKTSSSLNHKCSLLDQVLHINLGAGSAVAGEKAATQDVTDVENGDGGQHMMARSLCLVSFYSHASNNTSLVTKKGGSPAMGNKADMLLVGIGDGKLISFAVAQTGLSRCWSVHSRKEVSLGTHGILLMRLRNGAHLNPEVKSTCVLATGDRPTVVYLTGGNGGCSTNPKLCYSTISLTVEDDEEEDGQASHRSITVNAASSFRSSQLFSSAYTNDGHYSLCVCDENTLRLGVIDDVQKLHVTSYKLGMTPRRIAYHEAGRVYCVGCIDGDAAGGSGNQIGAELNMGNCVRFFDGSSFEEINRIDLEPFETILSLVSVSLSTNSPRTPQRQDDAKDYKPYILIGTAYAYPDEDEPTQGRVLVVECKSGHAQLKSEDDAWDGDSRDVRQITQMPTRGGVYSICPFYNGTVLLTVNSKTHLCQLSMDNDQRGELTIVGAGHHGHMLSLCLSSLANSSDTVSSGVGRQPKQLAIVGDLMRSISLVEYLPKHNVIEELARDYNANFCTAIEMLTSAIYLGSESFNNLFILRHNANASSEEARVRLDTVGEYHLGEMPNKFMGGSLIMPNQQGYSSADSGGSLTSEDVNSSPVKVSFDQKRK
ncbi:hypothetical protein HJC23_005899 [Cyclotella cryptica]|uniref:DNA damage-binding protein 1 n=1 Tax=Cyclotella cryptica TaxID=29204 RepID=A0ABD3QZC4_9STRA